MVLEHRVIGGPVVCDEEGPASPVAAVLVTLMQHIAVEEESITRLELHVD